MRVPAQEQRPTIRMAEHPSFDTLAVLNKLSNLDKHRTLATVASAVSFPYVGTNEGVTLDWHKAAVRFETLSEGTEILSFVARSKSEIKDVDVDPNFSYEVQVEGRSLVSTLVDFGMRVFERVTECETGRPFPWITAAGFYPIAQPLPGRHLDGSLVTRRAASTEKG